MLKDAVGNELHEGDYVVVELKKLIRVRIVKIVEPGVLDMPGTDKKNQMGIVTTQWISMDPIPKGMENIPGWFKSPDPTLDKHVSNLVDDAATPSGPLPLPSKFTKFK